jgi:peptidoglycan/xylan/chitin deacetylase (PgdA/CDA1 family)
VDRYATWAGAGLVAACLTACGTRIDRRFGTRPVATVLLGGVAGAYLAATFSPRARLFGPSAAVAAHAGEFALTFDDGPDPRYTPAISRLLAARGHRATFFVLARAVQAHPDAARAVLADGHELACHGDDHRLLAFAPPGELRRQLESAENALLVATGRLPERMFRPPNGVRSPWLTRVMSDRGYAVCAWDGAVFDTAEPGVAAIVGRVERLLRPGAVILLHDGDGSGRGRPRRQTLEALPAILDAAERRGLRSVALGSLVG